MTATLTGSMGIAKEINELSNKIASVDNWLMRASRDFWANEGICCPSCGYPGYSEKEDELIKLKKRMEELLYRQALHTSTFNTVSEVVTAESICVKYLSDRIRELEFSNDPSVVSCKVNKLRQKLAKARIKFKLHFERIQ